MRLQRNRVSIPLLVWFILLRSFICSTPFLFQFHYWSDLYKVAGILMHEDIQGFNSTIGLIYTNGTERSAGNKSVSIPLLVWFIPFWTPQCSSSSKCFNSTIGLIYTVGSVFVSLTTHVSIPLLVWFIQFSFNIFYIFRRLFQFHYWSDLYWCVWWSFITSHRFNSTIGLIYTPARQMPSPR